MRVALSVTTKPKPQWPSTTAVVGVSLSTSNGAPGTIWPRSMRSQYSGIWMTPWESWPTRLAFTWCVATILASSGGVPLGYVDVVGGLFPRYSGVKTGMGVPPWGYAGMDNRDGWDCSRNCALGCAPRPAAQLYECRWRELLAEPHVRRRFPLELLLEVMPARSPLVPLG